MGSRLRHALGAPLRHLPEVLQGTAIVLGWALVTWGMASLLVWQVWPISVGLFCLSLAGWGHLRVLFSAGVYRLMWGER